MKRIIFSFALLLVAAGLQAQIKKISPVYWVVETNSKQKNYSIIRLYDSANQLVHQVRMDGYYFDVTRARHRKKLDLLLSGYFFRPADYSKRNRQRSLTLADL
jgi:hypothetical protein